PKHRTPRLLSHRVNYTLTATNLRRAPLSQPFQPRILLVGDPAARPEGLERFLVRGGFQVTEAAYPVPGADRAEAQPPDLLIFASGGREARLGDAVRDLATSSPRRSEEHTLNSSHVAISYAVFCLKKKTTTKNRHT